jgi:hypothetical protein
LANCETLEWAGFDDWRLPDRSEILTIVDFHAEIPFVFSEFDVAGLDHAWTSTNIAAEVDRGCSTLFDMGTQGSTVKWGELDVLCVRGGP